MIQIYYGDGKGKTTAALGACLRILGAGKRANFFSFLKDNSSGERASRAGIEFYPCPDQVPFLWKMKEQEKADYQLWVDRAVKAAAGSDADLLVLDEFLDVIDIFISEQEARAFLLSLKGEVIITGHKPCSTLLDLADYITQMSSRRHPYDQGVQARKGIEF